ncbi:MAG: TetR family transcriptional regulator [Methylophilaceae bacterium]
MVRQTKENAELTRQRIIEAAREVFLSRGVSRTSIEQVANQAGVTRGAVYWHFSDKKALFSAMREQVILPLIDRIDENILNENNDDPLGKIGDFLYDTIRALDESAYTRQTFEIMMVKCEYVEELTELLEQTLCNCERIAKKIEQLYERAKTKGQLNPSDSPAILAMDTHLFFSGLMHLWVKDLDSKHYRNQAADLITNHINLRRK